jgi:hypothetical protein
MPLGSRALAKVATYKNIYLHTEATEQIVAAVAAGLGVLVVTLIAVLMGMT